MDLFPLSFQTDFKAAIINWKELYGDIVGVQLGSEMAVFLSDFDSLARYVKKIIYY